MAAIPTKLKQTHLLLLLISTAFLLSQPPSSAADNVCPYPCYPSPPGGTATPATTTPPFSGQTGSSSYNPPPSFQYTPPSTGNLPYYPPPTGYGYGTGGGGYGGGSGGVSPPPPDPILPYFPFYFKNGAHGDSPPSSSSSTVRDQVLWRSTLHIILPFFVIFPLYFSS